MSRKKILDIAHAEVGTKETPAGSNKTKYGAWYGFDGYAWCAQFVSWVYDQAGHPLGRVDDDKGFRDCRSGYNHWKATGEITNTPTGGDIILYDWNNDGRCDHTGIFVQWLDAAQTKFSAIEGNTAKGNDSDGGMVMLRDDRKVNGVKAFIKPKVLNGAEPPVVPKEEIWKKGDKNASIAQVQKQLYDLGCAITVDGDFGPQTEKIVKEFQTKNGLPVTGTITPALRGLLESMSDPLKVSAKKLTTGAYMKKDDSGAAVIDLQKALNKSGADPKITLDGVFGNETLMAVKAFQKKQKIATDGIAGPETMTALGLQ